MIQYKEAINIIKKISLKLNSEKISILNSVNRISSTDIRSASINPLHNNTAFDGFAVIAKETKGISIKNPKKFKIINIKLLVKSGGKKGLWINPDGIPDKIKNILNL